MDVSIQSEVPRKWGIVEPKGGKIGKAPRGNLSKYGYEF